MRPNLYDKAVVGDVTEVFRAEKPLSLIVAADSYIYFGDLVPLFSSMQESLANDGIVAFTLENVDAESEETYVNRHGCVFHFLLRKVPNFFATFAFFSVSTRRSQIGGGN